MVTNANPNPEAIFEGGQRVLVYSLVSVSGLFLIMMALPFLLGSGPADEALADDGVREIEVILTEFTIQPTSFAFDAGDRVKFVIENRGGVVHEFRLTSLSSATAHAEGGHEGHHDSEAGTDEAGDVLLLVNPKQTETLEVTFDEHSVFDLAACLLPGHFEAGMTSPLSIAGVMVHADDAHDHATDDHATDDHTTDAAHDDDHATDDHTTDAAHDDDHAMDDTTDAAHDDDHAMDDMTDDAHDDDHAMDDMPTADREIFIFMDEFAFDPSNIEVARGETVSFTIINAGQLAHEFRFTTEHVALEHVAGGDGHHTGDDGDLVVALEPGAAGTLVVHFDEAIEFDTIACFLDDHYESGLSAPLTVTS